MEFLAVAHDEPTLAAWHLVERLGSQGRLSRGFSGVVTMPVTPPLPPGEFVPIDDEIRELERIRMSEALAAADDIQTVAAELIKMPLRTFQTKAKLYGLRPKDRR